MKRYDLIVIGSGPAGEKAAVKAGYFGHRVALVEKDERYGGAGVQTGTLPSKALKETALYFSGIYEKGIYSIDHDFTRRAGIHDFMYRKNLLTSALGSEVKTNLACHHVDVYQGVGSFDDPHHIRISGALEEVIYGENILIATGSYPFRPADIPFDGQRVHDSDTILDIRRFPKSLCVLGAGVIGCAYATIFAAMGVKVFLLNNRDKILGFLDQEISNALVEQMKNRDVTLLFKASSNGFQVPEDEAEPMRISITTGQTLNVDMFLYAAGRSGNIRSLRCENAGCKTGERETLMVNDNFQTSVPHIYAVGDVIGFPALASTSMDQGRMAVAHMFKTHDLDQLTDVFPYGIYTVPEVSMVGMTEEEVRKRGISYCAGYCDYRDITRGKILGITDGGFMKVIFHRETKHILGVHIVGRMATELIHYGMALVKDKKTVDEVIATVFNNPSLHDLYKYACYDGLGNLAGHKLKRSARASQGNLQAGRG